MVLSPGWFEPSLSSPPVGVGGWFGGSAGGGLLPASVVRAPSSELLSELVLPVSPAVGGVCSLPAGPSAPWLPPGASEVGSVLRDWSAGGLLTPVSSAVSSADAG